MSKNKKKASQTKTGNAAASAPADLAREVPAVATDHASAAALTNVKALKTASPQKANAAAASSAKAAGPKNAGPKKSKAAMTAGTDAKSTARAGSDIKAGAAANAKAASPTVPSEAGAAADAKSASSTVPNEGSAAGARAAGAAVSASAPAGTAAAGGDGSASGAAGSGAGSAGAGSGAEGGQVVTPWTVKADASKKEFDYAHLTATFGLEPIDEALLARWGKVTGAALHPWLARRIFYAHKGLSDVLDAVEAKRPVYLYTGRGPSNDMHIGHSLSFLFTKYLQDALKCPVVIQLSDEEKFYFKADLSRETIETYLQENAKDIIAFGFDPAKTFIFSNFRYGGVMHELSAELMRIVNVNQFNNIYGFNDQSLVGQVYWPVQQIVPAFSGAFPHLFKPEEKAVCLVPMGVDQAVYFRCARDYATKLGYPKPAMICAKFLPGLGGDGDKMSSTGAGADKSLYLNSDEKTMRDKIMKYAFSGGRATMAEHRLLGGDLSVDVSYKYLEFFEHDDQALLAIAQRFSKGEMGAADIKKEMCKKLWAFLHAHQTKRALVTPETLRKFMPATKITLG